MAIPAGVYEVGPENADLLVHTFAAGVAGTLGHDLMLRCENWSATVQATRAINNCALSVKADLRSLVVVSGSGGATPLTAKNIAEIEKNIKKSLDTAKWPELTFESTSIEGTWTRARVVGEITAHGQRTTQELQMHDGGGSVTIIGRITQSRLGIKPFSAMLGALRINDDVEVEVTVNF